MQFIHSLHLVLFYMLVVSNLMLIPVSAVLGFTYGRLFFAETLLISPDISALLAVFTAFAAVGVVNGLIAVVIMKSGLAP